MSELRERIGEVVLAAVAVSFEPRMSNNDGLIKAVRELRETPIVETDGDALEWGARWKQRAQAAEAENQRLRVVVLRCDKEMDEHISARVDAEAALARIEVRR
jgi:hypothetical protein